MVKWSRQVLWCPWRLGREWWLCVLPLASVQILGEVDEFNGAVKRVLNQVTFNTDVVVSVFETNIRILG